MNQNCYQFDQHTLTIRDPELNLDISEVFKPVLIPEQLKNGLELGEGHHLRIFRFSDGSFEYYIEKGSQCDGEYQLIYPHGTLKQRSFYSEGKLHGPSVYYNPEGGIFLQTWFLKGKRTGKLEAFYRSGEVYSIQNYLNNVWHGKQQFWYKNGTLKTAMDYDAGEVHGEVLLYYPNGKLKRTLVFERGLCTKDA